MSKTAKSWRRTLVTVTGQGYFPIEMLRYDSCVPMNLEDAQIIALARPDGVTREIKLWRFSYEASKASAARWESFGWIVTHDTGVSV